MADGFKGREFLIQRITGGVGVTIAGGRSKSMSINNEQVDVTQSDNMPWRVLLEDAGVKSMSLSISGVFIDDPSLDQAMQDCLAQSIDDYINISGRGDAFAGPFMYASIERSAEYNDAEQYSISLESAGEIVYTPASS